ncbi:phytoene desaturase family protein [Gimesia chilikensis]|uniref:phytoene desaturase family protein n=1 Tax=Gimesia chilikensis TaxID=2605989 RepID=UPI001188B540|nr:NAD(P)/FAD-dependent oxidoreductase [Gimesia chilikensis]QDT84953.1 zeta-carotene-forming phytoene desaturase [Gimesia chilikensis]
MYDCVIIGAGHNGLVCAHQLARQGWKVLVLERRDLVGGACVTEELWPGFKVSTASYLVSLLLPEIEQEMELARYGYRVLPRNPSSFTPCTDGRSLLLGPDLKQNQEQIAQFSQRDAEQFPRYEAMLERIAECLEPALVQTPPDLLPLPASWRSIGLGKKLRDTKTAYHLHQSLKRLGETIPEAIELLTGPALPILDRWFESDVLKSTLATDAIIGTFQPPSAPGTAYVLLHHVMGSAGGARGVWGYVEGGMGALSQAMAASAQASGVEIRTGVSVDEILIQGQQTTGVRLSSGETIATRSVASNADAHVTFEKLIPAGTLPQNFSAAVSRIDYSSASMKINVAVSELPDFTCLPGHNEPGPQHRGTIHIGASCEEIERAYDDAKYGMPSQKPIIEMTIPTAVDNTLAPEGQHILSLFVQYAPYQLKQGNWDEIKEEFADRCLQRIAEFAPNVPASVLHRQILSPLDLERTFSLTGGNIFQGAMPAHQLYNLRPVPGWSDYRTPIKGLYLCGSAAHPGGGVMGACGRNAAREMLRDGKN